MKKRYLITMIVSLVALIIVAAAVTRAWFTGLNNEAVINGETQGIVFSYKITDGTTEKTDVAVYDVKGIAFFDVESELEGKFFASMACELTLTYTNICTDNISLTLTYVPDQVTTGAYVAGLITTEKIEDSKDYASVNDVVSACKAGDTATTYTINKITPDEEVVVYLYLYGVAPANADGSFLANKYGFKLKAKALKEVVDASGDEEAGS